MGLGTTRPRVEGDREREILDGALEVLAEVGYDRLTMDAVAAAARASKATLYRRWSSKAALVIDALCDETPAHQLPDTGTLRGDLLGLFCGMDGLTDTHVTRVMASVMTAVGRDEEFAAAFRERFVGPKTAMTTELYQRAQARGEISHEIDVDLVGPALPGIVLHRVFVLGEKPTAAFITRVIDEIILPAVGVGQRTSTASSAGIAASS